MDNVFQVAGIHDFEEAKLAIQGGANWLGIPLRLPSGKDDITEADAKDLISRLPDEVTPVLISYMVDADELASFTREIGFQAVQLHGDISVDEVRRLRSLNSDLFILKSLVVRSDNAQELLEVERSMEDFVDMFLTDTYNPGTGAMGATGLRHDWSVSKAIVDNTSKPVIIAGGLNPENVYEAVREINPYGVDAHTGLEGPDGRKDLALVRKFCDEARRAFEKNRASASWHTEEMEPPS